MKKVLLLTLALSLPAAAESLFKDANIDHGIQLRDPSYTQVAIPNEYRMVNGVKCPLIVHRASGRVDRLLFQNLPSVEASSTTLAQWDSKSNLINGTSTFRYDFHKWDDGHKEFEIKKLDRDNTAFRMKIVGQSEKGSYIETNNPCVEKRHPQLLLSREPKKLPVGHFSELRLNLNLKRTLEYLPPNELRNWDRSQRTAHFLIHINMQNIKGSRATNPGFAQGFGIGVNLYDARNSVYHDWSFIHKPQQRLIKYIAPNRLSGDFTNNLHGGRVSQMDANLMPHIEAAFRSAIAEGKKAGSHAARLYSENLQDYVITSVNIGWENSSLHNVEMLVNKYDLNYKLKNNMALPDDIIQSEIQDSFKRLLKRDITPSHLSRLSNDVTSGRITLPSIENNFLYSNEHITKSIKNLYITILKREADQNGLDHHQKNIIERRKTLAGVERDIKKSREYLSKEITILYTQLLKRAPDSHGLDRFIHDVQSGKSDLEGVRNALLGSIEYRTKNPS